MKKLFFLALFFCLSLSANAGNIQLSSVGYGGTACPPGSVNVALAPDGTSLTILYSQFAANVNGAQRSDEKNCSVKIKIRKPVLLGYILESADFRGFVGLEAGVRARQSVNVQNGFGQYFLNQQFAFADWAGPVSQSYLLQSVKPVRAGNLVDCANQIRNQTMLQFDTKVQMQSDSGGQGLFAVDSVDGRIQQTYRFKFVNCLAAPFGR